jgi:hypothetical protein
LHYHVFILFGLLPVIKSKRYANRITYDVMYCNNRGIVDLLARTNIFGGIVMDNNYPYLLSRLLK